MYMKLGLQEVENWTELDLAIQEYNDSDNYKDIL